MYSMTDNLLKEFLKTAVSAARLAGDIIMKNLSQLSPSDIQTKQAFDFVTKVDRWSEAVIMQTIREKFPSHTFLAEETLKQEETDSYRWIIDPLDGTTNYIHGYPMFSVSIALEYKKEVIVGVVFDSLKDELFHAVRGKGAFLNNRQIHVSPTELPEKSLIATGFPFRAKEMVDLYLTAFRAVFEEVSDIRRAGSAALDLAYLAAGRCEGFFELKLSPWDIAAGSLLIEEAGGTITDFGGGSDYLSTGNVVAGNKSLHPEILKKIRQVFAGKVDR
jgi:myo-inositol-1(or 4)-monophosphatase